MVPILTMHPCIWATLNLTTLMSRLDDRWWQLKIIGVVLHLQAMHSLILRYVWCCRRAHWCTAGGAVTMDTRCLVSSERIGSYGWATLMVHWMALVLYAVQSQILAQLSLNFCFTTFSSLSVFSSRSSLLELSSLFEILLVIFTLWTYWPKRLELKIWNYHWSDWHRSLHILYYIDKWYQFCYFNC